jgi:hypothetical protein
MHIKPHLGVAEEQLSLSEAGFDLPDRAISGQLGCTKAGGGLSSLQVARTYGPWAAQQSQRGTIPVPMRLKASLACAWSESRSAEPIASAGNPEPSPTWQVCPIIRLLYGGITLTKIPFAWYDGKAQLAVDVWVGAHSASNNYLIRPGATDANATKNTNTALKSLNEYEFFFPRR